MNWICEDRIIGERARRYLVMSMEAWDNIRLFLIPMLV